MYFLRSHVPWSAFAALVESMLHQITTGKFCIIAIPTASLVSKPEILAILIHVLGLKLSANA